MYLMSGGGKLDTGHSYARNCNSNSYIVLKNGVCKEVQCLDLNGSIKDGKSELIALSTPPRELSGIGNNLGSLEHRIETTIQKAQFIPLLLFIKSCWTEQTGNSDSINQLTKRRSHKANVMDDSSFSFSTNVDGVEGTPPDGFEKFFPGRPEGLHKMAPKLDYEGAANLSRNNSESSIGSTFVADLKAWKSVSLADECIPAIGSFVAGMKELAAMENEKYQGTVNGKPVKSVGSGTLQNIGNSYELAYTVPKKA